MKILNKNGKYMIWGLVLLVIPLCFLTTGDTTTHHRISPLLRSLNQFVAFTGYSMFALTFVLSARIKYLERYFGGLDKMYQIHHQMALVSFCLMFLHPFLLGLRWVPDQLGRFFMTIFPLHRKFDVNLGSYALWGIILLMVFTLAIKLPYRIWKISHKFMGLFFILMIIHTFHLTVSYSQNPLLWIYLCVISFLGLAAFIYQTLLFNVFNKGILYKVDRIEQFNDRIMNIMLSPCGNKISFSPGQFCFFSFDYPGISAESHPYTLFSGKEGEGAELMVKALGDYTRQLYSTIKPGVKVRLTGPYGCFNLNATEKKQIWIAGGVGIAPFMSWVRSLKQHVVPGLDATLYYCVHGPKDAVFYDELKAFEQTSSGFHVKLICTEDGGRLKMAGLPDVKEKEIFLCGPKRMCNPFVDELKESGVSSESIHCENFDF